jgi:hypothetical protein
VHVRIIEAGKKKSSSGIQQAGLRTTPARDVSIAANRDNALAQNGHRLRGGIRRIHRPDFCVGNDQISGWAGLRRRYAAERDNGPKRKCSESIRSHWLLK